MAIPWQISVALAGSALLALALVAGLTLIEIRRTLRNVTELSAAADRHLPAILQNLEEIDRNVSALSSSIQTLTGKASETAEGFDKISSGIHLTAESFTAGVIDPGLKAVRVLSTLLAFGVLLRSARPFRLLFRKRRGRNRRDR